MRKLLPYEHQLIESLGITKEEYLEFVAIQQEYRDPKAGTALDVRNADGGATVALVLTIVGTIFQVAAAFLFRPDVPDVGGARRRQRQQRFAPSYGFNSAQELARYGDPVNLVYTRGADNEGRDRDDYNPNGGVRVAGSLVWSAIENFGSTQFMQLQMVLGASEIKRIDPDKIAFGQLALSTLNPGLIWAFYKNGTGNHKSLRFKDRILGDIDLFPEKLKGSDSAHVCRIRGKETLGFSQAYSPTTSTSLGVYDPIPVNVDVLTRNKKGKKRDAPINIKVTTNNWDTDNGDFYVEGQTIDIKFEDSDNRDGDSEARGLAADIRRQTAEALTYGATYALGAAKFRLLEFTSNSNHQDVDKNDVFARFKCIEGGHRPTSSYSTTKPITQDEDSRKELEEAERILSNNSDVNDEVVANSLRIRFGSLSYDFNNTETITWTNELDKAGSYPLSRVGSIEYTKQERAKFLAEKPTIDVQKLIEEIEDDLDKANDEIDDIQGGEYDEAGSLSNDIDDLLDADRNSTSLKRQIGYINVKIDEIKEELDVEVNKITPSNRLKQESFRNDFGGEKSQRVVLSKDTSIKLKKIQQLEEKLDKLRERREKRRNKLIVKARRTYVRQLRRSSSGFTGLSGNRYGSGGIRAMEKRLKTLPDKGQITDKTGTKKIRQAYDALINEKRQALRGVRDVLETFDEKYVQSLDNNFFVKCLVKSESASYETVSECDSVRFSIKSTLFRRVSGRQKKYADEEAPDGYKNGDNGVKGRMAFFRLSYKSDTDPDYEILPVIFAIRHGSESDFYNQLNFQSNDRKRYSFKFDPVYDVNAETLTNGQKRFGLIENSDTLADYERSGFKFSWYGRNVTSTNEWGFPNLKERGPRYTNEWDMFSVNTDTQTQFSHESGPELAITAVTEQQKDSSYTTKYQDFSMLALAVYAGRGIQDLRNVTAFVTQGKKSYKVGDLSAPANDSTCFAPDIFVDTVLDPVHGVGKYTDSSALDQDSLILAKQFCKYNGLPVESGGSIRLCMDGVIADAGSWRSFWAENAPFSLLELARKNGADTLVPAIPVNFSGAAADSNGLPVPLEVSALFTPGNILEGSYKEEFLDYGSATQDLIASVIYRDQSKDEVFSTNRSVEVRSRNLEDADGLRQTFDASQFVTQREQAILFGKLLVNQRKYIKKAVEFKTFPSQAAIEPGAFIYVDIGVKIWDNYSTGIVMEGGALNVPLQDTIANGTYSFLFYDPKTGDVSSSSHSVTNNVASGVAAENIGRMFVMGAAKPSKRVYRVSEVAIEEDGEVSVKAIEYPCFEEGGQTRAHIADFRSSNFDVS